METFTFLFTDIEDSTALLRRLGEGLYAQVLADHHSLIRSGLAAHDGREVDTQGDAFFAVFSSPTACMAAVMEMQRALAAHSWPAGEHVRVRMGVHTGEASRTATGLVGLDVHRAARVAAVGYGGQVLLSETAAALVRDALPPGAALADLGVHRLKDLGRPERIFQLQAAGLQAGFPPLRSLGNPALPNNLPAQLATFIGREQELSEVRALVESSRLVTLTGAGGCGKTRLSLQVAAELLDGSGDGVWLVELAAVTDQDAVAPAICEALGIVRPAGSAGPGYAPARCPRPAGHADRAGQLRASDRRLRQDRRCHPAATARECATGGHQPRAARHRRRERSTGCRRCRFPDPAIRDSPAPESSDAVALFVERAQAQGAGLSADDADQPADRVDLRAAGRAAAGHRAGRRPAALAVAAAASTTASTSVSGCSPGEAAPPRRGSRPCGRPSTGPIRCSTAPSSCCCGACRCSPRASIWTPPKRSAASATSRRSTSPTCSARWWTRAWSWPSQPGPALRYRLLETIRQFAAERLAETGHDEAAAVSGGALRALSVGRRDGSPSSDRARARAAGSRGWTPTRRTCGAPPSMRPTTPDGTEQVLRFGVALRRYWMARNRGRGSRRPAPAGAGPARGPGRP